MKIKEYFRHKLQTCHECYACYVSFKYRIQCLLSLRYFFYDLRIVKKSMFWGKNEQMELAQLRAKLLFYYHKIEKGLCMPGQHRLFALEVVPQIIHMMNSWKKSNFSVNDPIYQGALNSLQAYLTHLENQKLDPENKILPTVYSFLSNQCYFGDTADTPMLIEKEQLINSVSFSSLHNMYLARRSVRNFESKPVSQEILRHAVAAAQLSPSACNRQPCKVVAVSDESLRASLLAHQNGNTGFGHMAPLLLVVTANADHFFGAIERNQPYIDGGLFAMSLLYALEVHGLATCCLNWCVTPKTDSVVHQLLNLPKSHKIIMFIAVGYPHQQTKVPRSHRKALIDVLSFK